MNKRYEIRDKNDPSVRGYRFTDLHNAMVEWGQSVPLSRWGIWDRQEKVWVD